MLPMLKLETNYGFHELKLSSGNQVWDERMGMCKI